MTENQTMEQPSDIFDIIEIDSIPAEPEALTLESLPQEIFQIFEIEESNSAL